MNIITYIKKHIVSGYTLSALLLLCVLFVFAATVHADEDQFIVRQIVGGDTTPPTTPTSLVATAISTTQIDLSWTASTDNSLTVAGYQVFRDMVFVATTTLTSYSDIDLTPSTTYAYTVTAFDNPVNISEHSATSSATTLALPTVDVEDTTTVDDGGGRSGPTTQVEYFSISPDVYTAWIQVGTNVPVKTITKWGITADYELGSVAGPVYLTDHVIQLDGLLPNTRYVVRVEMTDARGRTLIIDNQEFTTRSLPDIFPPENISDFRATPDTSRIVLTWKNPKVDFASVRIVRSDKFFPRDPMEGEVVYEGTGERYVDTDVVPNQPYYYAAFVRDPMGNYSSGALAGARLLNPGESPFVQDLFAGIVQLPRSSIDPLLQNFVVGDIRFVQDGAELAAADSKVTLRGDRDFVIAIDYNKMPEVLKTIVVTLHDPVDSSKTFSFLLRVNKEKTAYEAHVAPLGRAGEYAFTVSVLDHKKQGLVAVQGSIFSTMPDTFSGNNSTLFDKIKENPLINFSIVAVLMIILGIFYKIHRHKVILTSKAVTGALILLLLFTAYVPGTLHAAFNKEINYQGKLTNTSNVSVSDGTYHMRFKLYTVPTGGVEVWSEDRSTAPGDRITVSNGLFSVMLGSSTPLSTVDFNQTLYLGVEIGGSAGAASWDGEMTPRKKIGAVPAAIETDRIDGLSSEQFLRSDTSNSTSTASTFLSIVQSGAGKIAEFVGQSAAAVFNIASGGAVNVGTSTGYARFNVWGAGTGTGLLANFVNNASTTVMSIFDNGRVQIGTTSANAVLTVASTTGGVATFGTSNFLEITSPLGTSNTGVSIIGSYLSGIEVEGNYQTSSGPNGFSAFTDASILNTTVVGAGNSLWSIKSSPTIKGTENITELVGFKANPLSVASGIHSFAGTVANTSLFSSDLSSLLSGTFTNFNIFKGDTSSVGATINNLYGLNMGDITAGTALNYAIKTGLGLVSFGDKVGIGTTTPYAPLSVYGQVVGSYFTATSTTQASTFPYASTTALTVSGTGGLQLATGLNGPLQANSGLVSATTSIGVVYGGTGLTAAPSYGQMLLGNSSGGYTLTATSSLGITSSQWTTSGSNIFYNTGNVSIGTSSAYARFNVWGAGTGTGILANFANNASSSVMTLLDNGNVGIGTTSPYAKFSIAGDVVGGYFTATTTTATSSFLGVLSVGSVTPTSTAMFAVGTSSPLLSVNKTSGAVQLPQLPQCSYLETGTNGSVACAPVTSYKMDQIYARFTQEDASVFIIGDSTSAGSSTPRWGQSIIRKWDVPWVGFVAGQFESSTPDEGFQTFGTPTAVITPGNNFADGSGANNTFLNFHEVDATTGNFLNTRLTSLDKYLRGDWTKDKQMVARTFHHLPAGAQSGANGSISANMSSGNNSSTSGSMTISSTLEAVEKSFAAQNYQPNTYLEYQLFNYFTTSSMHTGAVEYYAPGKKGFSLWTNGISGSHTYDWIHSDVDVRGNFSATQIQNTLGLAARKVNTFILQLGINGSADESTADGGATYKSRIETIIDHWKADAEAAGGTDIKFLLINPWETSQDDPAWPVLRGKILLQIAHERSYVSFIDLSKLMLESYGDNWQDTYLADGIHQNQAGVNAIGDVTWKEISKGKAPLWSSVGREVFTNPLLTSGTSWSGTNDCSLTSNAATCSFSGGSASTITQTSTNFVVPVSSGKWYKFVYTVSGVSGTPAAYITTGISDQQTKLDISSGTHITYFRTASTPGNFVVTTTLTSGQAFTLDSLGLTEIEDGNLVVNGSITGGGMTGLKITSTGNVGVGSTTPYGKLSVQGSYGDLNPLFMVASTTSATGATFTNFIIDRSGNVGIGTSSPYAKLSVAGESVLGNSATAGYFIATTSTASVFPNASTTLISVSNNAYFPGSGVWNSSGNVGIGTTSPYAKLSVAGQVVADYFTSTSTTASTFPYASTTALTVSGNAYFANSSIWNSSGKIGVGTTTPNTDDFIAIRAPSSVSEVGKAFISMTAPNSVTDTKFGIEYIHYPVQSGALVPDEYFNVFKRTGKKNSNIDLTGIEFKFVNEFPYYNPGIAATTTELYYELNNTQTGLSAIRPWGMEILLDTGRTYTSFTSQNNFAIATSTSAASTVFRVDGNPGMVYIEGALSVGAAGVGTHNVTSGILLANKTPTVTLNNLYADTSGNLTWSQGTSWQGASLFNTGNGGLTLAMSVKRTAQFDSGVSSQSAITAFGRSGQSVDIVNVRDVGAGNVLFNVGFSPDYKVGVGTTTPWAKFSVNASALTAGVPQFVVGSSTATHLIVANGGNVGVGTTTPWRKFSVTGTVAMSGLTSSATGNAVCITTGKDITDAGAASCTPSSERFKENIETLTPGLAISKLNQLRVVSFDYKEGFYSPEDAPHAYGMIAEEVQEVDPYLVDLGYDGLPRTLQFEKILALTVQAVQELSQGGGGFANLSLDSVITALGNLGMNIVDGVAYLKGLFVETLTVGTPEKPTGITLYDEVTGEPYCLKIVSGKMKSVQGECKTKEDEDDNGGGGSVTPVDPVEVKQAEVVPLDDEGGGTVILPGDDSQPGVDSGADGGDRGSDTDENTDTQDGSANDSDTPSSPGDGAAPVE